MKSPVHFVNPLADRIGVTRVARVTGLDRAGVEVACAVRPGAHVLQVSNGKGTDAGRARMGAVLEAAELWAAENPDPSRLVFASLAELEEQGAHVWPLDEELALPEIFSPSLRIAWIAARVLAARDLDRKARTEEVLVPASAAHCVPSSGPWLGPSVHRWTSNGMGAHPDGELALCHALLEAAERDGLARTLPQGWTERALRMRKLNLDSLSEAAPRAAALVAGLRDRGLTAQLFDLHPDRAAAKRNRGAQSRRWIDLALAGALLIDDEDGPIPVAAGYACAVDPDDALAGALLEAAQSRLTDVHGAREDIEPADRSSMVSLAKACRRAAGAIAAGSMAVGQAKKSASSGEIVHRFVAAGFDRIAAIDLAPPDLPARVVKVIVPGLLLSELL